MPGQAEGELLVSNASKIIMASSGVFISDLSDHEGFQACMQDDHVSIGYAWWSAY